MFCFACRDSKKVDATQETLNNAAAVAESPLRDFGIKVAASLTPGDIYTMKLDEFTTGGDPTQIFTIGTKFAEGSFGTLYNAIDKRDGKQVVVKQLALTIEEEVALAEIRGHAVATRHKGVCGLYGVFLEEGWLTWTSTSSRRVWLVLEHLPGPTLSEHFSDGIKNEKTVAAFVKDMTETIAYLHKNRLIHRDLKAMNWMLDGENKVRLIDFGSSTLVPPGAQGVTEEAVVGSPAYLAPEVYGGECSYASDMFALGALTYQIYNGVSPFGFAEYRIGQLLSNPQINTVTAIRKLQEEVRAQRVVMPKAATPNFESFVQGLVKNEPSERMDAETALKHAFLAV
eukprot:PhM_4_TR5634/c0_g1_i1/m.7780